MTDSIPAANSMAPVPERIGHYVIERELGAGGMGSVYLGRHDETGQLAAVKVLPAAMSRESGFRARFDREIAALQKLRSPQIVELYESGEDDGVYFYAMEYVPGETLTERLLREKRLPWREAIVIAVQVCRALKAAHNAGVIHRDLKPSNLMLHEDGGVKLTDFGVAQVFASNKLTVTGGILGTAEYMSPEQAQGQRATRQSDIYSLGAVLYVMLTGRPPFTGKTTLDIAQKHRFAQFDSPKRIVTDIPYWLDEIVCKCLAKKPEDRYPDAYVLGLRLQEVPKRVDLKSGEAIEFDGALPSQETQVDGESPIGRDVVGGTFARDLFRAELERQRDSSVWGRALDNVWVLVAVLVLLIAGAVFLARWNRLTPEQRFAKGEALMQSPPGSAWETAARDYFEPLLQEDEAAWAARVEPHLARVRSWQLRKDLLGRSLTRDPLPQSEAEAQLRRALELRRVGQSALAAQRLRNLSLLLTAAGEAPELRDLADELAIEIESAPLIGRSTLLQRSLEEAERLHAAGEADSARRIWQSVVDLYDADPDARDAVDQSRRRLSE